MNHQDAGVTQEFQGKIPVRNGIQRISIGMIEAQQVGSQFAVNREGSTSQGRSP